MLAEPKSYILITRTGSSPRASASPQRRGGGASGSSSQLALSGRLILLNSCARASPVRRRICAMADADAKEAAPRKKTIGSRVVSHMLHEEFHVT